MKKLESIFKALDDNKNYGILLSGGLDSTILLAYICKYNPGIPITAYTIKKLDGSYMYVDRIIEMISERYPSSAASNVMIDIDTSIHHREQNSVGVNWIFSNTSCEILFNALNRVPEELSKYNGAPDRASTSTDPRIILPFVDWTKSDIVYMMIEEDLSEFAWVTHSCTRLSHSRCGICYQCVERKLAFIENEIDDKGQL